MGDDTNNQNPAQAPVAPATDMPAAPMDTPAPVAPATPAWTPNPAPVAPATPAVETPVAEPEAQVTEEAPVTTETPAPAAEENNGTGTAV